MALFRPVIAPSRSAITRRLVALTTAGSVAVTVTGAVLVATAAPAGAQPLRNTAVSRAAHYGTSHGYHVGIAVLDTRTGRVYGGGAATKTFASESVVKVMIASRLFAQHRMHGSTRARAYKMITQSDDAIASSLYGSVGGDGLVNWVKRHYHVPDLGSPPHRAGWWGNTHITPDGLVRLYGKLKADHHVGPWLLKTMHHAHKYGSDGFYQWFGLHQADPHAAIKQGWGTDYDDWGRSADENTTGFVDGDRYAVAILARGPAGTYGNQIGAMLTRTARILLPHGQFPGGAPVVTSVSRTYVAAAGGTGLTIRGHDLDHASVVWFGGHHGTHLHLVSPNELTVTAPAHAPGSVTVRVTTNHGKSSVRGKQVRYVNPPGVRSLSPSSGAEGQTVRITAWNLLEVQRVSFGTAQATHWKVLSQHQMQVTVPAHAPGEANVQIVTRFGSSKVTPKSAFTYQS